MLKTATKRLKWGILIAVTVLLLAAMLPVARARREYAVTQKLLMECAGQARAPAIKQLIAQGADVNGRCLANCPPAMDQGSTAIKLCAENPFSDPIEALQTLLDAGADINLATDDGTTALMRAVTLPSPEVAKFLIERGADVNQRGDAVKWRGMPIARKMSAMDIANYYSTPASQRTYSKDLPLAKLKRIRQMLIDAGAQP